MNCVSEIEALLALDEYGLGHFSERPVPPGWGVLRAGEILADAGPRENIPPETADSVVRGLVELYWKAKYQGQRRRALNILSRIGGPGVPRYFLEAARSQTPQVRELAAEALAELDEQGVQDGLRALLDDPEASVRAAACLALGGRGDVSALEPLVERLQDESGKVRRCAAEALGMLGDRRAVPGLLAALEDLGIAVRKKAAEALGKIGDPSVLDKLSRVLQTGTVSEKWNAAETLADWNAPEAIPLLAEALTEKSTKVRKRVTYALGNFRFPEAVKPLGRSLEDDSVEVRGRAAYGLGLTSSPQAVPYLVRALEDESESVRKKAADSLAALLAEGVNSPGSDDPQWQEGRKALGRLLAGGDKDLRIRAAFGLALCGDAEAVEIVRRAATHDQAAFRRKAMEVLGRLGAQQEKKEALERDAAILLNGMQDPDAAVRCNAASALSEIGKKSPRGPGGELESVIEGVLASALEDEEARVRDAAFESWYVRRERKERKER